MPSNGDTQLVVQIGGNPVVGIGSFHKTLKHDKFGEVDEKAFKAFTAAVGDGPQHPGNNNFKAVPTGCECAAPFVNPRAGLAKDRLTAEPSKYTMDPAPKVLSKGTAAEMVELYWMALMRDESLDKLDATVHTTAAVEEINEAYKKAVADGDLMPGVDLPGAKGTFKEFTKDNLFRLGLPGDDVGPMLSQFFVREVGFGTQTIDQKQRPYKYNLDFLTSVQDWLNAQNCGRGADGEDYPRSNEASDAYYDNGKRYISTMRDLARFVNKDALHQAYFNGALLLLGGGARWTPGNPYRQDIPKPKEEFEREAGFGTLGGPHILALVSEVATRALKVVWHQKWQTHLRLRPEAYGGLVHMQVIGTGGQKRPYGLPDLVTKSEAASRICNRPAKTLLLPMAFTAGSPKHPAYGAGHATVAGCCVTVLKAYFEMLAPCDMKEGREPKPKSIKTLANFPTFETGVTFDDKEPNGYTARVNPVSPGAMTIEGELNKLASNVAMGRSMGGVHWRTDNTRSLILGEALAAQILADITSDLSEKPKFTFRTFARDARGEPATVTIEGGKVFAGTTEVYDSAKGGALSSIPV